MWLLLAHALHRHSAVQTEAEGVKGLEGASQAERAFVNISLVKMGGLLLKNKLSV